MSFTDGLGGAQRQTRWLTPHWIVESLGKFNLDPCGAPNHVLAEQTFQIDEGQDGLVLPWDGRVWLNPPYGRQALPFMEKMAQHNFGTAFLFARTETRMFHKFVWPVASGIFFLRGRISFLNADLFAEGHANAPSCLISYGANDAQILANSKLPGYFVSLNT